MKLRTGFMARFATIAVLCTTGALSHASAAEIPWHVTEGAPAINVGKEVAYFVWHQDEEVYVAVTNTNPKGDSFTGTIHVTDGLISDLDAIHLEKDDTIKLVDPHTVTFSFKTYQKLDGLKFHMGRDASRVLLDVDMNGTNPAHIYAGDGRYDVAGAQAADGYIHFAVRADDDAPFKWSLTAGMPNIVVGRQVGYFVWHDAKYVYVVCTDESKTPENFDGEVRLHTGSITNIMAMNANSKYALIELNRMRWYFQTASGEAGIRFAIDPGAKLIGFTFHMNGKRTDHVFYGLHEIELNRDADDSVVFDLTK